MKTKLIKQDLEKLGLSARQADVYWLLVRQSEIRISQIVSALQIPRSSVYEILRKLFEFGLVEEIIDGKFKRLKAYPLSAFKHRLEEKIDELQKLRTGAAELEKTLSLLPEGEALPSTIVRYYKGVAGGRQLMWNSLKAKDTVYVYSAYGRSKFVGKKFYKNFVAESSIRNIQEKVLINPTKRALELIKSDTGSALARTDTNDIRMLGKKSLNIKGETFVYNNIYALIYLYNQEINGFEIESQRFSETQRSIFETLWAMAKPIAYLKPVKRR